MRRYWATLELHFWAEDDSEAQEIVEKIVYHDFGSEVDDRIIFFVYEDIVSFDEKKGGSDELLEL